MKTNNNHFKTVLPLLLTGNVPYVFFTQTDRYIKGEIKRFKVGSNRIIIRLEKILDSPAVYLRMQTHKEDVLYQLTVEKVLSNGIDYILSQPKLLEQKKVGAIITNKNIYLPIRFIDMQVLIGTQKTNVEQLLEVNYISRSKLIIKFDDKHNPDEICKELKGDMQLIDRKGGVSAIVVVAKKIMSEKYIEVSYKAVDSALKNLDFTTEETRLDFLEKLDSVSKCGVICD